MVVVIEYLGFGVIVNLIYEVLFLFVCCMFMLDYLSCGCVGWNIVIGYFDSVVCVMGLYEQLEYDQCYDCVDEFMEVVYKFWEGSWEDGVVVCDCVCCVYVDLVKVYKIVYYGDYYYVEGIYLSELLCQCMFVLY